ncbi:MAG: putative sulfate exporter family transporter, partial [Candidatus Afipia apatlaquensis]|nr:putative sulfate exporter family transporter [Candidatus Afipia apatlaquensis]
MNTLASPIVSRADVTVSLDNDTAGPVPSGPERGLGAATLAVLPGLLLTSAVAASAYALRQLPGMATFSPMILAILIGIAFHNLAGTPAIAKPGVT